MTNGTGGYFSDFSRTQAARSYLTRSKCVRPIFRQSRITSCSAESNFCETAAISLFNSSLMRMVFTISSFFASFIPSLSKRNYYRANAKK